MVELFLALSFIAIEIGFYLAVFEVCWRTNFFWFFLCLTFSPLTFFVLPLIAGIKWGYWRALKVWGAGWVGLVLAAGAM